MVKFLDFGDVPLAGAFLREDQLAGELVYPLEVQFCKNCTLVQVNNAIPAEILFRHYFYFSSAIQTLVQHFRELAEEIVKGFETPSDRFVVEIGCNDGVFLKPLASLGVKCVGVDPATNVVESSGLPPTMVVNDYFTEQVARRIRERHGQADVIVSSYSFAHIDDMLDVMEGIQTLLREEGVFIFEVYYLGIMLDEMQYDMIYHEHMSYYSLVALQRFFARFGLEIYDLKRVQLRAGTIRFYAQKAGAQLRGVSSSVDELRAYERDRKLDSLEAYRTFAAAVERSRIELLDLLTRLKEKGQRIIGYGASGRATTMMNYCGIDERYLDYVVDDAPAKHGLYTPGTHLPIRPWSLADRRPDYVLVFAWSFIDEVRRRRAEYLQQGGKFIVPLPRVSILTA